MGLIKQTFIFLIKKKASLTRKGRLKYARKIGVNVADGVTFTGMPDFGSEPWLIEIKNGAVIAADVNFITHDGSVTALRKIDDKYKNIIKFGKIVLEEDCFIGKGAFILPNVRIGKGAIVGAMAVVSKDVPDGVVVAGNPAKIIATCEQVAEKWLNNTPDYDEKELDANLDNKKRISLEIAESIWEKKHNGKQ